VFNAETPGHWTGSASYRALGGENAQVAALNNLAELYRAQGKEAEAEPLRVEALAIWVKALGPEHPKIAIALNNLAQSYGLTGMGERRGPFWFRSDCSQGREIFPALVCPSRADLKTPSCGNVKDDSQRSLTTTGHMTIYAYCPGASLSPDHIQIGDEPDRQSQFDRKTIRKYLIQPDGVPVYGPRVLQPGKLEAFKPYLEERMTAGVWNAPHSCILAKSRETKDGNPGRNPGSTGGNAHVTHQTLSR
jgi:hypothetical protein